MRIGIVVKEFPPKNVGGTETQTMGMASELQKRGHDVTVFTKRYPEGNEMDVDYEVVRVPNLRWNSFVSTLTFLVLCLVSLFRRSDELDCLQCMMIYPVGFLGYVNRRVSGTPYFAWIRGGDYYFMKNVWWKRWTIRKVLEDTLVLVQSSEIEEDVKEDFPDLDTRIRVLGNGVSVPEDTASGDKVVFVGRLAEMKGVEYLVEAMSRLGSDDELVVVGDGPERDELEALADGLGVNASFEGFVDPEDVGGYYTQAAVFVLPSTGEEGMPNAVLEAMSWGVPVVTTDSGGLPSMVSDGENGFIVPRGDARALSSKIGTLLEDEEKRRRMGENARDYVVENHSWDSLVSRLENVYAELVSQ